MKKIYSSLLATTLILSSLSQMASANPAQSVYSPIPKIKINGQVQTFDQDPVIVNDFTLVSLRGVFEALGAEVQWDETTKRVTATKGTQRVELEVGSNTAFKNGMPIQLDIIPQVVNGRTMVPLRFVSEALGAEVKWDAATKTIDIIESIVNGQGSLTLDQAVELAIANSRELKQLEADRERNEEVRDSLSDQLVFTPSGTGNGENDARDRQVVKGLSQTDLALEMSKKQVELTKESIAYSTKKAYDDLILQLKSSELADLSIEHAEWQKRLVEVKLENGMSSQTDLTQVENSVREKKAQKELATKAVEDAYQKLNHLIGKEPKDRYELTDTTPFTKMAEVELESHINQVISSSTAVWLAEQKVKLAEIDVDLYTFNSSGSDSYQAEKIDVKKAQLSAADTKEQMKQSIRNIYYSVKQLEEQYEALTANLNKVEEGLKLVQTKYEVGMATALEVFDAKLQVENLNKQILDITLKVEQLKIAFDKPWVLAQ